jgi:hypothetical protein
VQQRVGKWRQPAVVVDCLMAGQKAAEIFTHGSDEF